MNKNAKIKLQGYYTCKVTNKVVTVQILTSSPRGGWEAVNTKTGKTIHIKNPERLIKAVAAPKDTAQKTVKKATSKGTTPKPPQTKMRLLDVTAKVLKTEAPLTCRQIIERLFETGLWTSEGATPANTLHAAISKEIRVMGKDSRFEKVDRGRFGLKAG